MRTWATETYGLPPHRVIGSIGTTEFRLGDNGPELVNGPDLQILNDGPQKPISIHTHVGQRPILAAGNTDGDLPMLQWTAASPYRTLELEVLFQSSPRLYGRKAFSHGHAWGDGGRVWDGQLWTKQPGSVQEV
jgi:hypothetical protein